MDAFDADALIYAAAPGHELGRRVLALFPSEPPETTGSAAGIGSVYLMPEVLIRPVRNQDLDESVALGALLARLDLRPADDATGRLAVILGAKYGAPCRGCDPPRNGGPSRGTAIHHQQQQGLPEVDHGDQHHVSG